MKNLNNPSKIIIALLMLSALTLPFLLIVSIVCWILIGIIRFAFGCSYKSEMYVGKCRFFLHS